MDTPLHIHLHMKELHLAWCLVEVDMHDVDMDRPELDFCQSRVDYIGSF